MLQRCSICPRIDRRGPIEPTGPRPCRVLVFGEGPAKNEDYKKKPFVGASGRELDNYYLPLAGLDRDEVGVTNAMKCSLQGYRNPDPKEAAVCAEFHLKRELEQFDPEIIVPMGAVACSLFEPKVTLELHHGMPLIRSLFDWVGIVFPNYHPAAGMRDSRYLTHLHDDFPLLRDIISGKASIDVEPKERDGDYGLVDTEAELKRELRMISPWETAIDTETDTQGPEPDALRDPPYMLSFSGRPNAGKAIMADRPDLLREFYEWLLKHDPVVDMHNSLFDMTVTKRMGLPLPWKRIRDTMIDAYHACRLDQGLKTLSYRLLHAPMQDFEDLVKPYALTPQSEWLASVALADDIEQPWLKPRRWRISRKALAAFNAVMEGKADPEDRIKNWTKKGEERDFWAAEDKVGKFPWMSIRFVPVELAAYYAGMDAARTLELRHEISIRANRMRRDCGA